MKQLLSLKIPGTNGQQTEILAPSGIPTGGLSEDGGNIIGLAISIFLIVCILLAFGFLLYGGINWITSAGDKTKIDSARNTIIYAVIGLIVAFLALFVTNIIGQVLGVDLLNFSL